MENNKISLSEISLREKIAQMIIVGGGTFDSRFVELGIGGIFLPKFNSEEIYRDFILRYQKNSKIRLFVAGDVEGWRTPFDNFYKGKVFGDIKNKEEAYLLGKEQGAIMKKLGFNINFSPVVEMKNAVWPGRSFKGSLEGVKSKIKSYIKGLQEEGILATAKHYPGGSMVKDPHKIRYSAEICDEDLELFNEAIEAGGSAVMVGHPVVFGAIDSKGKQCTVSPEVISILRKKFDGLIITDNISMTGLKSSYSNFKEVYPDLVRAGNDIILDCHSESTYDKIIERIIEIEKSVKKGEISEERIDDSAKRILKAKGYFV